MDHTEFDHEPGSDEDVHDGIPVNGLEIRLKAFLLLMIFLLPSILIVIEFVTGSVSGWWNRSVLPMLPFLKQVHF